MLAITNTEHGIADYAPFPRDLRILDVDYLADRSDKNTTIGVSLTNRLHNLNAPYPAPGMGRKQQPAAGSSPSWQTSLLPVITNPGSIGPADLASLSSFAGLATSATATQPAQPEDRPSGTLAIASSQVAVSETFTGEMTLSGGLDATNGTANATATFGGSLGIVLYADLNASGSGEGEEVASGSIKVHYNTPNGSSNTTKPFSFVTRYFPITNGTFNYSYFGETQIFGALFTVTLKGSANANLSQFSNSMEVPIVGSEGTILIAGSLDGSGTVTAPPLAIHGTGNSYTVDTSPVRPFTNAAIVDFDTGQTVTVSVTMSDPANGTLSNLGGGSFNSSTGVFTVKGSAQAVTAALEGLEFNPTLYEGPVDEVIPTTFTISASDGTGASATNSATTVSTTETAPPPALSGGGDSVSYQPGGAAVILDPNIIVSDSATSVLAGATVSIGQGFQAGDILNFTNQNNIVGNYDAATGVLSLSGDDSLANYQAALQSITFSSTDPEPSAAGTDLQRTISWAVVDVLQPSNVVDSTVVIGIPTTVHNGETQIVSSGMTAYETTVLSGGMQIVESGGQAFATTISSGGEIVFDGGITGGLSLRTGAIEGLAPGQTVSGLSVAFGIELLVSSAAVASGTNLVLGGFEDVLQGGIVIGNSVGAAGTISVSSGGTASASDISSGGTEKVLSGGTADGVAVSSGGKLLSIYGQISGGTVFAGGVADLFAGTDTNTTLSGGELLVLNGASAANLLVQSGGLVVAGEFAGGTTGGTLSQGTVEAGGVLVLGEQSQADGITVDGTLLQLTGVTSAVTLAGSEFVATTLFGPAQTAVASATTVEAGGLQTVNSMGSAVGSIILDGGEVQVNSGGVADGAMVSSGGVLVSVYGEIGGTAVFSGGIVDQFAGTGDGATVSGGHLLVLNGAVDSGVDVTAGGLVLAGTFAGGTVGGTIEGGAVSSGGLAVLGTASVMSGTTIQSGGILFELAGQASGIGLAGLDYVGGSLPGVAPPNPPPSAIATDTTVSSGGTQQVNSGGSAVDTSVLSGGEIVFNGGAVTGLSVTSGGVIDLATFAFSSSTKLSFIENAQSTGGTLTVGSGVDSLTINLLGQYVAGGFQESQDSGTGTAIAYNPPATSNVELAGHPGTG